MGEENCSVVSVQKKNSSVLKTPVLTHQARSSAENQRTPMEKTRTWLQTAAPSETGAEETFLLSGELKKNRLWPGECNTGRARSCSRGRLGRGAMEKPPGGAPAMGSRQNRLWGTLKLSPRMDGPPGGMMDITCAAAQCQVSQKGCPGCCLAQQRGLVPRGVPSEGWCPPGAAVVRAETKCCQRRYTQHLSAQTCTFGGVWNVAILPSCFEIYFFSH